MIDWQQIKLGRNDRGALIGATGSGKTFLGRYLIEDPEKKNSVVWDAKISDSIGKWNHTFIENFGELLESRERRIVYRPGTFESLDAVHQNEFFEFIYLRRFTRLFIDEATTIAGGSNPSQALLGLLARGRERGISTLVGTQRPARIPVVLLSESEHFYLFRLTAPQDRKTIQELTGGRVTVEDMLNLDEFEFYYYSPLKGAYTGGKNPFDKLAPPKKLIVNPV